MTRLARIECPRCGHITSYIETGAAPGQLRWTQRHRRSPHHARRYAELIAERGTSTRPPRSVDPADAAEMQRLADEVRETATEVVVRDPRMPGSPPQFDRATGRYTPGTPAELAFVHAIEAFETSCTNCTADRLTVSSAQLLAALRCWRPGKPATITATIA